MIYSRAPNMQPIVMGSVLAELCRILISNYLRNVKTHHYDAEVK